MAISDSDKAKCTIAPRLGVSNGSLRLVLGSIGLRSFLYCSMASSKDWLNSVLISTVAIGKPLIKNTRSKMPASLEGWYLSCGTTRKILAL